MIKHFFLSAAALALCAGCATTTTTSKSSDVTTSKESRLFADYLIGSYTNYIDDAENRSEYYGRAFAEDKTDIGVARRAVTAAVTAGETDKSRRLARDILRYHPNEPMSRAVLGTKSFADKNYAAAINQFDLETSDLTVKIMMDVMKAWSQSALGDSSAGGTTLDGLPGGAYFQVLGRVMQANMGAPSGDYSGEEFNLAEAEESYTLALASGVAPTETALSRARLYSDLGQIEKAAESLKKFEEENGSFESGPVKTYLKALEAGQPVPENLSPQDEAAWALTEAAYGFFLRNRAFDVAEVYIRTALTLSPDNDKSKIWLAALIEDSRQDEALELYRSVDPNSAYAVSARLSEANIFFDRDEDNTALKILEETNSQYPSLTTREALGRARLIRENYKEALPIYDELVNSMSDEDIKDNIQPLYFRAVCYEREKQWDKAVTDFQRVLEIEPDNADALNYLGYTWVDRNENLTEAFDMIEKAVELEPESGAIIDSLGWAHYKLGRYSEARKNLEKAVELTPDSATIVDHLGDVYWKLGRFREAGFQWKRALEYDPTDEERRNIEAKLRGGLSAAISN